jgi:hypothetical protein
MQGKKDLYQGAPPSMQGKERFVSEHAVKHVGEEIFVSPLCLPLDPKKRDRL